MLSFNSYMNRILLIFKLSLACVAAVIVCGGCGSSRGILFEQLEPAVVWPGAPEQARIQYVGALSTEEDLKREVSGMAAFGRFIFGRDDIGVLVSPRGVAVDDNERLYVADTSGGVVHMMDMESRKYEQFSELKGDETLASPVGVVVVGEDIYVTDSALGKVCVFSTEGKFKFSFGSGRLERPSGIAYNALQDTLYVADAKRHVVEVFSLRGQHVLGIDGRVDGGGAFNFPTYIWIDREGKLYVSDTLNYCVKVFGADGRFLRAIGKHGNRPGYFAHPCGVAVDSHGNIYVSDKQFENIQIFNSEGQMLMAVGGEGHGPGQFWLPAGIFIDDRDRIFVADSFNKRVQVLQLLEVETP
jgi:DNA-binding beta-propeller fold protein YncE